MVKLQPDFWTSEKLKSLQRKQLESVRENAVRHGLSDLVIRCDVELQNKATPKSKRATRPQAEHSEPDVVGGYHFVCGQDRGVTPIDGGRFWSGSWKVDEDNVRNSIKYGAYLALHESKAEPSYRHGQIIDYRRSPRDMVSKTEDGIEFLVQMTDRAYAWVGSGAGEKGYNWIKLASTAKNEPEPSSL